jgi:hypothetical protein
MAKNVKKRAVEISYWQVGERCHSKNIKNSENFFGNFLGNFFGKIRKNWRIAEFLFGQIRVCSTVICRL